MKLQEVNNLKRQKLYEGLQHSRQILAESVSGLTEDQARVVNHIYRKFTPLIHSVLTEAPLTKAQIDQIFQNIETGATAAGGNRTLLGKGVDVGKTVSKITDQFGEWLQTTTPVQAADQKFEKLKKDIKAKLGDDSRVMKGINSLGQWAKDNPGTSAAVIGLMTVIASIAGSPAAGTVVAYTLRGALELIKGEKLSTAVGRGLKTAAITWLAGQALELVKDGILAVFDRIADIYKITTTITPVNDVIGDVNMMVEVNGRSYIDVSNMPMFKADYEVLDKLRDQVFQSAERDAAAFASAHQAFYQKLAEVSTADYAAKLAAAAQQSGETISNVAVFDTVRDGINSVGDAVIALGQGAAAAASAMPGDKKPEEEKGTELDTEKDKEESGPGNRKVGDVVQFGAAGDPSNARWTGEAGKEWEIVGGALHDQLIDDPSKDRLNNIQRDTSSKVHRLFIDKDSAKNMFTLEARRLAPGKQFAIFEAIQYIYENPAVLTQIQTSATKLLQKLAVKGGNLTNKVTADKLRQAWEKAGSPMDSNDFAEFMSTQNLDTGVVDKAYDAILGYKPSVSNADAKAKRAEIQAAKADAKAKADAEDAKAKADAETKAAEVPTTEPTKPTNPAPTTSTPTASTTTTPKELNTEKLAVHVKAFKDKKGVLPDAVKARLQAIISKAEAPAPAPAPTESLQVSKKSLTEAIARSRQQLMLTEAKARIDHPEDLVFEEGSAGARRALEAIVHAASNPSTATVKWDGTPAIIFGRDDQGFILTDKSGFGAKKYDGMARSSTMFRDMLYNRKPDEPGRLEYSTQLAKLFPMLEKMVPVKFRGFIQGDVMWMNPLEEHNGVFEIQPLKVKYTIDASSDLGKKIKKSQAGVVVHSYFSDKSEEEPRAMTPAEIESLKPSPGLMVLSPVMQVRSEGFELPKADIEKVQQFIQSKGPAIDRLLDNMTVSSLKISNLPDIFKSFLNFKAYQGKDGFVQQEFLNWLNSPDSKLTANKLQNVMAHLEKNKAGFDAVFKLANALVNLKYLLKAQLDAHASQNNSVLATVKGQPGHEGFVADTPHGKIKLVNRPVFMKK